MQPVSPCHFVSVGVYAIGLWQTAGVLVGPESGPSHSQLRLLSLSPRPTAGTALGLLCSHEVSNSG